MTKKIFRAIFTVAVVVLLAALVVILGALYSYFSQLQSLALADQAALAAAGVEREGLAYFQDLDAGRLRFTWVDGEGRVLYDSQAAPEQMENHLQRQEIQQALLEGQGQSRRMSATLSRLTLYQARLLTDGTVLRLATEHYSLARLLLDLARPLLLILILALGLAWHLSRRLAQRVAVPLLSFDQEQRAKGEQLRREFTANVSHELKTPLHAISASAELIENGLVQSEDVPRFAANIRSEAARLLALIEDVIRLSQLDEGVDLPCDRVELAALSREALLALTDAAQRAEISLELDAPEGEYYFYGVRRLLYEIIYNLCDNAVKYNRPGGRVQVLLRKKEGRLLLTVKDTGRGIPLASQSRVFERFYRVDKSHSRRTGGTGLGLSIVKHAAQYHQAEIQLRSTVDVGTEISVLFPAQG